RAMSRMSKDLEFILTQHNAAPDDAGSLSAWPEVISLRFGRTNVRIEAGRIQDYSSTDSRMVTALPANEYFDDKCISDANSSLGALVQHHFQNHLDDFVRQVKSKLVDVPSQRVPRAESQVGESYGIGEAIFLDLQSDCRLILVSATTERTGIGLRAEPHFLYA